MPPRVFVSSVMEEYERYRTAARHGIEAAGCEPVMVEDFPSLDVSPRNACLDAVQSCDVYVGILGSRAGYEAPSGRTVVEEEFEEARTRGLPLLIFIQEVEREPRQQDFADRVSDFIEGQFRNSFADPEELEQEIRRALERLDSTVNENAVEAARWVSERLAEGLFPRGRGPTLRMALAPLRREEVIDPRGIPGMGRTILEAGHSEPIGLFSYGSGYESEAKETSIRVTPVSHGASGASESRGAVEFYEDGGLFVETNVTNLRDRGDRTFGLQVIEEDVATQLRRIFALAAALYRRVDEFRRHQGLVYQAELYDLSYHRLAPEGEAQATGRGIPMGRDGNVTAHPEPRQINRRDLEDPDEEVERTMERFRRRLAG